MLLVWFRKNALGAFENAKKLYTELKSQKIERGVKNTKNYEKALINDCH